MMNAETPYTEEKSNRQAAALRLVRSQADQPQVKPLPFWQALALFLLPAAIAALSFYLWRPWLEMHYDPLTSYLASLCVPAALLFAAALVGYHKVDGYPLERSAFARRMRFPRPRIKDLLLGLAVFAAGFVGVGLFSAIGRALVQAGWVPVPAGIPLLVSPLAGLNLQALNQAAGGVIRGRWDIAALYVVTFFFNIVGEELWWRGYILPRQELAQGRYAWLLNGLLWTFFHLFQWWNLIGLLPVCLAIAFAGQRFKNNWPGLLSHALMNAAPLVLVIVGVII